MNQNHPRRIAQAAIADHRQRVRKTTELVALLISLKPPAQLRQRWPVDGPHSLQTLMADCYLGGVFVGPIKEKG